MRSIYLLVCGAVCLAAASGVADTGAAQLTPEQRTGLIVRPEYYDVMHGKIDRLCLNGWWRFPSAGSG